MLSSSAPRSCAQDVHGAEENRSAVNAAMSSANTDLHPEPAAKFMETN